MFWIASLICILAGLLLRFTLYAVIQYFLDPKGLRKYPNLHLLSGISNLPLIYESHKGFRSHKLLEAHKKHPIIQVGPNSLSFGHHAAIKDIYGHQTKCSKDLFYSKLCGTHFHLADVIDKGAHARKRKTMASAYTIKNLEDWEFKVADMTNRMMRAFDSRCTAALQEGQLPHQDDLTID